MKSSHVKVSKCITNPLQLSKLPSHYLIMHVSWSLQFKYFFPIDTAFTHSWHMLYKPWQVGEHGTCRLLIKDIPRTVCFTTTIYVKITQRSLPLNTFVKANQQQHCILIESELHILRILFINEVWGSHSGIAEKWNVTRCHISGARICSHGLNTIQLYSLYWQTTYPFINISSLGC